ncbi:MAG TPA: endonuclease/exonuclease/phosphatase family protein [Thermoanaerobaculia bacterium]|jgi:hypothetical protein|nr:endonuclease/exonuclease/phosphatase family protein [Thermoanaerobaculia bacterium]
MPDFNVVYWNIENLGNNAPYRHYHALFSFIARVARTVEADVLALMEVRYAAIDRLGDLRVALNAAFADVAPAGDWHFDWLPAAIAGDYPDAGGEPAALLHLGWEKQANKEGYAVFWNNNPNKVVMLESPATVSAGVDSDTNGMSQGGPALGGIARALRLVVSGRKRADDPNDFDDNELPRADPIPPWAREQLDFPTNISNVPRRRSPRRPAACAVRLKTAADDAGTVASLLVYHAPGVIAFSQVAFVATRFFSFAESIYRLGGAVPDQVVAGGDLNVDAMSDDELAAASLRSFTNALNAGVPGAGCQQLNGAVAASRSSINLSRGLFGRGGRILSANAADYRTFAIDHVFHKGFIGVGAVANGPVLDLISLVMQNDGPLSQSVRAFIPLFYPPPMLVPALPAAAPPPALAPPRAVNNGADFLLGIRQGHFPNARSAAEFVKLLISDHLPVVFRGQY